MPLLLNGGPGGTRFNGAPTTWSGIAGRDAQGGIFSLASTGPRPRGRGSRKPSSVSWARRRASTGPRPRGRGSDAERIPHRDPEHASTGPRPRGRGSLTLKVGTSLLGQASTGPRPRGRGSRAMEAGGIGGGGGFNGAPTTWSGIGVTVRLAVSVVAASTGPRPRGRGSPPPARRRAPVLEASTGPRPRGRGSMPRENAIGCARAASTGPRPRGRGSMFAIGQVLNVLRASTGPRPRGRGSWSSPTSSTLRKPLQRGPDHVVGDRRRRAAPPSRSRGFNGAPTTWSGIAGGRPRAFHGLAASTGPRPRGRGSMVRGARWSGAGVASTGPRPRGRGSEATEAKVAALFSASTGPRPRGRGSAEYQSDVWSGAKLQRGPDHVVGDRWRGGGGP